jgi:transcriptional regulator with XRE-family HTH domain
MGRPRQSRNSQPRKLTVARFERWKRGLSLSTVSAVTTIPLDLLSEIERGERIPSRPDLEALARIYGYPDPDALLSEAVIAVKEVEQAV